VTRVLRWGASAIVVVFLAYAATKLDWHAIAATVRHASPRLLIAAVVVNLLSLAIKGVRWSIFLRAVGVESIALAVRASFVGAGVNNIMIANSGEAARVLLVARQGRVSRSSVLATLALDRVFDPLCYVLLLLGAAWVLPLPAQLEHAQAAAAVLLGVLVAAMIWLIRSRAPDPVELYTKPWRARVRRFRVELSELASLSRMSSAFVLSAVVWAMQVADFALVARASGIRLPVAGSVAALLLTNAGLILRATPANVGYFQFAYALAAAPFGVATTAAIAAALLLQAVQILPVTALGMLWAPHFIRSSSHD
jgi:glycosyltransferase 2 family protein